MKRTLLLSSALVLMLAPLSAGAQEVFFSAGRNVLTNTKYVTSLVDGSRGCNSFDAGILWKASGTDAADMYNNPRIGLGFSYTNLGALDCVEGSSIGDSFALYGTFVRDVLT